MNKMKKYLCARFYKEFAQINKQDDPFVFIELKQMYDKPLKQQSYIMKFKVNCEDKEEIANIFMKKYDLAKNYQFISDSELSIKVTTHEDFIKLYKLFVDSFWFGEYNFKLYLTSLEHHYFWWSKKINEIQKGYNEKNEELANEFKDNDESNEKIISLENQLSESNKQINDLKMQVKEREKKATAWAEESMQMNEEIIKLNNEINQKDEEIKQCKGKLNSEYYFKKLTFSQIQTLITSNFKAPVLKHMLNKKIAIFEESKLFYLYALIFENKLINTSSYTNNSKYKETIDEILKILENIQYTDEILVEVLNLKLDDDSMTKFIDMYESEGEKDEEN